MLINESLPYSYSGMVFMRCIAIPWHQTPNQSYSFENEMNTGGRCLSRNRSISATVVRDRSLADVFHFSCQKRQSDVWTPDSDCVRSGNFPPIPCFTVDEIAV